MTSKLMSRAAILGLVLCAAPAAGQDGAYSPAQESSSAAPSEVVIKGASSLSEGVRGAKPPLQLSADPFESIRASFSPDESLLLAESPFAAAWRKTHPDVLHSDRIVQPWLTTFNGKFRVVFDVLQQLSETLARPLTLKEAKPYQWSLNVVDQAGRVFQHYEGSKRPPLELVWNGENDRDQWIMPEQSYSPVYAFLGPNNDSPRTRAGRPIRVEGMAHQEPDGMHLSAGSAVLFGSDKSGRTLEPGGESLLRAAADAIKRSFTGIPIKIKVFAATKDLGDSQGRAVQNYLRRELMLPSQGIDESAEIEANQAPFADQRVEIVLLNR